MGARRAAARAARWARTEFERTNVESATASGAKPPLKSLTTLCRNVIRASIAALPERRR